MLQIDPRLKNILDGNDFSKIKPIILMYRNMWNSDLNKFVVDTNPIKLSETLVKVSSLTQQLDISEISEYKASNMTLTFTNVKNEWDEGYINGLFSGVYRLYGSRFEVYLGADIYTGGLIEEVKTKMFTGVIQSLPNFKPEAYQVDIQIVSTLELLKKQTASVFSDTILGDSLAGIWPEYLTDYYGVGRIDKVYAGNTFETKQLLKNSQWKADLSNVANRVIITIEDAALEGKSFWADYIIWKRDLQIHEIVNGLLDFTEFTEEKRIVEPVIFNNQETETGTIDINNVVLGLGYKKDENNNFVSGNWFDVWDNAWDIPTISNNSYKERFSIFPEEFTVNFRAIVSYPVGGDNCTYALGDEPNLTGYQGFPLNGIAFQNTNLANTSYQFFFKCVNGNNTLIWTTPRDREFGGFRIKDNIVSIFDTSGAIIVTTPFDFACNYESLKARGSSRIRLVGYRLSLDTSSNIIPSSSIMYRVPSLVQVVENAGLATWLDVQAELNPVKPYSLNYAQSEDSLIFGPDTPIDFNTNISNQANYLRLTLAVNYTPGPIISVLNWKINYSNIGNLFLPIVSLGDLNIYDAIQQLALLSTYEFGLGRDGNFFFRQRIKSTTPTMSLTENEIVKFSSLKNNIDKLINKVRILFDDKNPVEITNNDESPNSLDLYGEQIKELDRPDLLTYVNIGLADYVGQAILKTYGQLHKEFQLTGVLNLSVNLGDITSVNRLLELTAPIDASDFDKYEGTLTYYRTCKIIGIIIDFEKKQNTYTLMDISNENNAPVNEGTPFVYEFVQEFD